MNVPCPVHGSRRAHHGCRHCRRPICRLCEVKMYGHLYCSTKCARDGARAELTVRIRHRLSRPVSGRLAVVLVLAACCAPTVLALRAVSELDRLNRPAPFSPASRATFVRIERVVPGPAGARIEGRAPSGGAVFLFAGSRFVATAYVERGEFHFDDVRVDGPYRVGSLALASAPPPEAESVLPAPIAAPAAANPILPAAFPATAAGRETSLPHAAGTVPASPPASEDRTSYQRRVVVPDLSRGPRDRREVLVSFDAGSSSRGAGEILDALRARRIRTTIFLTGEFIRRYPEIVRRVAAEGHEVGNHTDTHPHLTTYADNGRQATRPGVDRAYLERELARTARVYDATTGRSMAPIWRAPFGEQNDEIRLWAAQAGYWHVGWTGGRAGLDGMDWVSDPQSRAYRTSDRVVASLVERAENGGIVLLHLGSDRDDPVASRIPLLFEGLSRRGFAFVRASEFLAREGWTDERLAALSARARLEP
jgi:peptidoglycan/xylan/chitin deacetylase (PgdA/CDA1 family)